MKFVSVESSQISRIGCEKRPEGGCTLVVVFHKDGSENSAYSYANVPLHVVTEIVFADSIGKAFDAKVKKAGFRYQKLSEVPA